MPEWELLLYVGTHTYVVFAAPAAAKPKWTHNERTLPFFRLVRVALLPIEVETLMEPKKRVLYEDSARVRTLNRLVLPALPREGILPIDRDLFRTAVQ